MSDQLAAEALIAATGIWPTKAPDLNDLYAAEAIPDRWRTRARMWMLGKKYPVSWQDPPEKQSTLWDKLTRPLDEDEVAGWLDALGDPSVGTLYAEGIRRCREYVVGQWPKITIGAIVPETLPLSPDDYAQVWNLTRQANNPDVYVENLDSWSVLSPDTELMRECFPELTTMLGALWTFELVEHVAKKRSLMWQQEDVIRIMRGLGPEQQIQIPGLPEEKPPEQQKPGDFKIDFKATRVASEDAIARD